MKGFDAKRFWGKWASAGLALLGLGLGKAVAEAAGIKSVLIVSGIVMLFLIITACLQGRWQIIRLLRRRSIQISLALIVGIAISALCYDRNVSPIQSTTSAADWDATVAGLDDASIEFELARREHGIELSSPIDPVPIGTIMQKAAAGKAPAQVLLGLRYLDGIGVEQDFSLARQWFIKASDAHFGEGEYMVGLIYQNGFGVQINYVMAVYMYQRAAKDGSDLATHMLGMRSAKLSSEN